MNKSISQLGDVAFLLFLWPLITVVSLLIQYFLLNFNFYYFWLPFPIGAVLMLFYHFYWLKHHAISIPIDFEITNSWKLLILGTILSILLGLLTKFTLIFSFMLVVVGLYSLFNGLCFQYRFFYWLGGITIILALGSFFANFDFKILALAGAIFCSQLIPSYRLLKITNPQFWKKINK